MMGLRRRGRPDGERGGVTTITAILLGLGVFFGSLSIAVDYGQLMYERAQVQNGADASALSLARSCATKAADCKPNANALPDVNNANSWDALNAFQSQCGMNLPTGSTLAACNTTAASNAQELANCPPKPAQYSTAAWANVPYVEVRTKSDSATPGVIRNFFAQLSGGSATSSVGACARALWFSAGATGNTIPLVMGMCDWQAATVNGTKFAPPPPYTPAPNTASPPGVPTGLSTYVTAVFAHDNTSDGTNKCGVDPKSPGKYYPGGFGWTQDTGCVASFIANGTALQGSNGASVPDGCKSGGMQKYVGTVAYIPVMRHVDGTSYQLDGIAAFFVAGYNNAPAAGPKDFNAYSGNPCGSKDTCVWGWFTSGIIPVGTPAPPDVDNRGASTIGLGG